MIAWVIALRKVQDKIEKNPGGGLSAWDLLEGIEDDLSLPETICVLTVSSVGFAVCLYRMCKFFWMCCLRSRYEKCKRRDDDAVETFDPVESSMEVDPQIELPVRDKVE